MLMAKLLPTAMFLALHIVGPTLAWAQGVGAGSDLPLPSDQKVSACPFLATYRFLTEKWLVVTDPALAELLRSPNRIYVSSLSTSLDLLPQFEFDRGEFPQNNISQASEGDIFVVDQEYRAQMEIRGRVIRRFPQKAIQFADVPGIHRAKVEVLDLVLRSLQERYPGLIERTKSGIRNTATGQEWSNRYIKRNPFEVASHLVTEDMLLLRPRSSSEPLGPGDVPDNEIVGGILALPTHWSVLTHLGKSVNEIHAHAHADPEKVNRLNRTINGLLSKMSDGLIKKRNNWMPMLDPTLAQPDYRFQSMPKLSIVPPEKAGTDLFIRIERQTVSRLPSGFSLFTIKIYVFPIRDFVAVPTAGRRLLNGLEYWRRSTRPDSHSPEVDAIQKFLCQELGGCQ